MLENNLSAATKGQINDQNGGVTTHTSRTPPYTQQVTQDVDPNGLIKSISVLVKL